MESSPCTRNWPLRSAGGLLLLIPYVLQCSAIRSRGIDPDELEHLHAAFCVWRGLLPYRDFFEHHSPALYYLLQPAFWIYGPELQVLWLGRAAMSLMSLATVVITWQLAKLLKGETAAWTASLLLAWSSVYVLKGTELRPDVPACLCLALMTYFAVRSLGSARFLDWLGIGLLGGLATLFTQKGIVPVVSLAISLVLVHSVHHRRIADDLAIAFTPHATFKPTAAWIPFLGIGLGGTIVWTLLAITFAGFEALHKLLAGTVDQLVRLPIQSERWEHLRPTIAADLTLWLAGLLYLIVVARELARRQGEPLPQIVATACGGCLLSLAWVKAVYPQYVLLWLPWLAVTAATALDLIGRSTNRRVSMAILGLTLLISGIECKLLLDGLRDSPTSALSHLRTLWITWHIPPIAALILPIGLVAWSAFLFQSASARSWLVFPMAILGMSYAVARDANGWLWSNRPQVALIERVNSLASLEETVLDGFSGYGALRPHASYFWWINRYSLALMTSQDKAQLLKLLEDRSPAVVLYDRELKSWLEIQAPLEAGYSPTAEPPIWIRRRLSGGLKFPRAGAP